MKIVILFLLIFTIAVTSYCQDKKEVSKDFARDFVEADDLMAENNYNSALKLLLNLLNEDPDNANIQNKIGLCYLHTALDKDKAISYFEKAITNTAMGIKTESPKERRAPLEAYFNLGKALHANYKFIDAIKIYNGYLDKIVEVKNNDTLVENAEREIDICKNAIELMKHPLQMKVENLGAEINSPFADYSPFVNADETVLIFTSKREGSTGGLKTDDGNYMEDIYISNKDQNGKWSQAQNISTNINTNAHDASCGLSIDGQELFIFKDDKDKGNIYSSKLSGNSWSVPQSLGVFVNTKYYEKGASMSANGNFLFFSSDRPGGYGGFDIFISKKLPNGQWGEAFNLGPNVNTEYDEIGPFFHPDASTLYFASQGHNTMGGFDLFYSTINIEEATSTIPINIGYPINTTGDDVFITITPDGKRAYYSSYNKDGFGYTDIYLITLKEPINKSLTVFSGVVKKDGSSDVSGVQITVTDPDSQNDIGIYTPNSSTGKYILILNAGKKYITRYECDGYNTITNTTEISKDSTFENLNKTIKIDTVFLQKPSFSTILIFNRNSADLNNEITEALTKAVTFLNQNMEAFIVLQGKSGYNSKINEKREEAVINFLINKKIDKKRIYPKDAKLNSKHICNIQLHEKPEEQAQITENINDNKTIDQNNEDKTDNYDKNATRINVNDVKNLEKGMVLFNNIFFPINKAYLTEQAYTEINKILDMMNKYPKMIIEISGHTDKTGSKKLNNKLSRKRAKGVMDYLVLKGIDKKRLSFKGYGSSMPMVSNDTEDGRKLNRRVEFKIVSID